MERKEIFAYLESYLGDLLSPEEKFSERLSFIDDIGLDSLDVVDLLMECERNFNVIIANTVAESVETVGDLIDAVCNAKQR